jgi:outer membrane protein assembly factor BamB
VKASAAGLLTYNSASYIPNVKAQTTPRKEHKWSFETGGPVWSSPTVMDDTVYVGSLDGNLYAVDASSGDELWRGVEHTLDRLLDGEYDLLAS